MSWNILRRPISEWRINCRSVLEPARLEVRKWSYPTDVKGIYRILRHMNIAREAFCIFTKIFAFASAQPNAGGIHGSFTNQN